MYKQQIQTTKTFNKFKQQIHSTITYYYKNNKYKQQIHSTNTNNQYIQQLHATNTHIKYIQQLHATITNNKYKQQLHWKYKKNYYTHIHTYTNKKQIQIRKNVSLPQMIIVQGTHSVFLITAHHYNTWEGKLIIQRGNLLKLAYYMDDRGPTQAAIPYQIFRFVSSSWSSFVSTCCNAVMNVLKATQKRSNEKCKITQMLYSSNCWQWA